MRMINPRSALFGAIVVMIMQNIAFATNFNIPSGDLGTALGTYAALARVQLVVPQDVIKGARTKGAKGNLSADEALSEILVGTGFAARRESGAIAIVHDSSTSNDMSSLHLAAAPAVNVSGASLETVTVTSSKIGGDVQNIPIAITAFSQEQLTATQTTGGPDLVKQVPNLTFTKTNFTGYSIQIRGIGTQAISVTTDPAVAVAFNDVPFIRNHFFEQEFYDVSQLAVLRGPQGTLYGRNATAGVVNLTSAKPTDQFEAMASLEIGNYGERRPEGMINIPIVDDRLDIRIAGEWTKRQGYSFNTLTNSRTDGRDLWSGRVTIGWKPVENLQTYLIWEHFSEDDDRIRSSKQLCKRDPGPTEIGGIQIVQNESSEAGLSQGCLPASLYSPEAFEVPNGFSLPYFGALIGAGLFGSVGEPLVHGIDPYASQTQSTNLRVIESTLNPIYHAKNDIVEFNADYAIDPALTFTSQTAFNHDFLWSTQDYNRFNTEPGIFAYDPTQPANQQIIQPNGEFCDPQLGCSARLVAQDISDEHAWQLSQEFRIASNFSGPLNFTAGGNYLHYETEENYYVFINALTMAIARAPWVPGVSDNSECLPRGLRFVTPEQGASLAPLEEACSPAYIDPNPLTSLNNNGHNYFLSQNPYVLNSYAGFGEANYNIFSDLKLTAGLRWTEDRKHFSKLPSWVIAEGWGYPVTSVIDQQWDELTGRAVANWTPKLDFTDQTLIYGSYAHGYKAGGANPPGPVLIEVSDAEPVHPLTFKPEFIDAFEIGTKDTLLDGALTINANLFYYNYENYQISEIVDRTSINLNFDAHAKGAELETTWEPIPGLRFNFAGGWEDTALAKGSQAIDLMDRTAGHAGWIVVKPYPTLASNCIMPDYVVLAMGGATGVGSGNCIFPYVGNLYSVPGNPRAVFGPVDPVTGVPYVPNPVDSNGNPIVGPLGVYPGFDPSTAPNGGAGFDKNLGGNKLPNAPPYTMSLGAQYSMPLSSDWAGTLRSDFYWQDNSWWRVFNDNAFDRLHGYVNVNLSLILTSQTDWQVMLFDKNVFNTTAITGAFLNSDDTGLTTNVFLTDPKLIGIRVTKNW